MRLSLIVLLAALPLPALAQKTMEHCNYYIYATKLAGPLFGIESKPIEPNDTQKYLHAQQKICVRLRRLPNGGSERVPGSRTVSWKLSVAERDSPVPPPPPSSTITITPKKPDGEEL